MLYLSGEFFNVKNMQKHRVNSETSLGWCTGLNAQWLASSEMDERVSGSARGHSINLPCISLSS